SLDPWSARALTGLRAIAFAGDQLAVPGQDGVRPGHSCDLAENLAAEAMTDLAERGPLGVRELQSTFQLALQDAGFGGQIFVPRQQLVNRRGVPTPIGVANVLISLMSEGSNFDAYSHPAASSTPKGEQVSTTESEIPQLIVKIS